MGDLVPECLTAFLKDVAVWGRQDSILTEEDRRHLDRFKLPMHFISGSENRMFVPKSTEDSYRLLSQANGPTHYRRTVYEGSAISTAVSAKRRHRHLAGSGSVVRCRDAPTGRHRRRKCRFRSLMPVPVMIRLVAP